MAIIEYTDCFMTTETLADGSQLVTLEHTEPDGTLYRLSAAPPVAPLMAAEWIRTEVGRKVEYSDDGVTWRDKP